MGYFAGLLFLAILAVFLSNSNILCRVFPRSTRYLGTVGNKNYFVLRTKQNWAQAKEKCRQGNLELATIKIQPELDFLSSQYDYGVFHGWHWIDAHDRLEISQFKWDDGDEITIVPNLLHNGSYNSISTFATCGAFQINELGPKEAYVSMIDCTRDNGYALCELVV